jgi:hypothetical protein
MNAKELTTKIQTTFIGSDWRGEEETAEILNEIVGLKCECYDADIDDGVDDDESEDTYIMYASFRFEGSPLVVTINYGNVTEEIGYVEVRNAKEHETRDLYKEFVITSVTREDLECNGFDTTDITDEQMKELAKRMCSDYLEQMYWLSMRIIAEDIMEFPKK